MDGRWINEQIENWVSDFLIDDAGGRVDPAIAPVAQQVLVAFLMHACSIRKIAPDALEQSELKSALLEGLREVELPAGVEEKVPELLRDFLADLETRGRLADGEAHGLFIAALGDAYLQSVRGEVASIERTSAKIGRNDPCPCGSGRKYKKCCFGALDEKAS